MSRPTTGSSGRQVTRVLLERVERRLGIRRRDATVAAHFGQRGLDAFGARVARGEQPGDLRPAFLGQAEQQVLGRDELVAQPAGAGAGFGQHLGQGARHADLAAARARQLVELARELAGEHARVGFELAQDGRHDALGLREERDGQVRGGQLGVPGGLRRLLGAGQGFLGLGGVLGLHGPPKASCVPEQNRL